MDWSVPRNFPVASTSERHGSSPKLSGDSQSNAMQQRSFEACPDAPLRHASLSSASVISRPRTHFGCLAWQASVYYRVTGVSESVARTARFPFELPTAHYPTCICPQLRSGLPGPIGLNHHNHPQARYYYLPLSVRLNRIYPGPPESPYCLLYRQIKSAESWASLLPRP